MVTHCLGEATPREISAEDVVADFVAVLPVALRVAQSDPDRRQIGPTRTVGQVVRNGRRLVVPYTQHIAIRPDPYRDNFPLAPEALTTPRGRDMLQHHMRNGEVIVPPGVLFALGDNRDNSADSRYWGFVPREYVVGKPLLVYWSYDAPTAELQEWTLDHVIDVAEHFFTRTRWKRSVLVPRPERAEEVGGVR